MNKNECILFFLASLISVNVINFTLTVVTLVKVYFDFDSSDLGYIILTLAVLLTLKKFKIDQTFSVCVCVPHKRFLGNYSRHYYHQTWHGNCLRHGDASCVNDIDLELI